MSKEEQRVKFDISQTSQDSLSIIFEESPEAKQRSGSGIKSDDASSSADCADALAWDGDRMKREKKEEDIFLYIVMQLCQKESLRDWLRRSPSLNRERRKSLDMFREICLGVDYVHSRGLIHRDLKPSNIFFDQDGTIKIGDFGLVTDIGGAASCYDGGCDDSDKMISSSQHTDQVGTELYMSPEQAARLPYGHKVDIYSLGLVLLELLVPFSTQMERAKTLSDLRTRKVVPRGFEIDDACPLVKKMVSHDPTERPEAAEVMETDFLKDGIDDNTTGRVKTISGGSDQLSATD